MMQSIVDMPNRENVLWIENGTYQGGTDREFEAIHIYDPDTRVIAVFKKSTGKFVTTCQLESDEAKELIATGNFGGGEGWFSGKVRNLPPQQVQKTSKNENASTGFTATSSFESDVMGITPVDNPESDNL